MTCDLCGVTDSLASKLKQTDECDFRLLEEFYWITRQKRSNEKMVLNVLCINCFMKISRLVETVKEFWNIYYIYNNIVKMHADTFKENYGIYIPKKSNSTEFNVLEQAEDSNTDCCLEGYTKLEWLDEEEIHHNVLENTSENNLSKMKLSLNCKETNDSSGKENNMTARKMKHRRLKYSSTFLEFSKNFIIRKSNGKLCCTICNKELYSSKEKVNHIRTVHLHERPFICDECNKKFTTKSLLNHHIRFCHTKRILQCQICGEEFSTMSKFRSHENTHLNNPKHVCPEGKCGKEFNGPDALRNHINGCHSVKTFVCEKCGRIFVTAQRMKIHARRHSQKTIQCPLCPQMFFTRSDLGPHMKHHKTWPWNCFKCNMSFKSTRGLQQHFSVTHKERLTRLQLYKNTATI